MSAVDDRPRHMVITTEREEGDRVRLTVQDAGVGLDPQAMDRLSKHSTQLRMTVWGWDYP